jgi:hypothetical protein
VPHLLSSLFENPLKAYGYKLRLTLEAIRVLTAKYETGKWSVYATSALNTYVRVRGDRVAQLRQNQ